MYGLLYSIHAACIKLQVRFRFFVCLFVVVVVIFFKQGKLLNYVSLPSQRSWRDCYATRENLEVSFTCSQTCVAKRLTPRTPDRPSRCFIRQGTLLHFVSLRPGV